MPSTISQDQNTPRQLERLAVQRYLYSAAKRILAGQLFLDLIFLEQFQHKEDYPATLEKHLDWLRGVGLSATCLRLHLNLMLIAGVKAR